MTIKIFRLHIILGITFIYCLQSPPVYSETVEIQIIKSAFIPAVVKIKKGDTVRWINRDGLLHTVASGKAPIHDGKFKGDYVLTDFKTIIREDGVIDYFCELHSATMRGVILSEEASQAKLSH